MVQRAVNQFVGIEAAVDKFLVVILQVTHAGIHEQFVAVLHLDHKRVERVDHLVAIGDNHLVLIGIGHGCQIMLQ